MFNRFEKPTKAVGRLRRPCTLQLFTCLDGAMTPGARQRHGPLPLRFDDVPLGIRGIRLQLRPVLLDSGHRVTLRIQKEVDTPRLLTHLVCCNPTWILNEISRTAPDQQPPPHTDWPFQTWPPVALQSPHRFPKSKEGLRRHFVNSERRTHNKSCSVRVPFNGFNGCCLTALEALAGPCLCIQLAVAFNQGFQECHALFTIAAKACPTQ